MQTSNHTTAATVVAAVITRGGRVFVLSLVQISVLGGARGHDEGVLVVEVIAEVTEALDFLAAAGVDAVRMRDLQHLAQIFNDILKTWRGSNVCTIGVIE